MNGLKAFCIAGWIVLVGTACGKSTPTKNVGSAATSGATATYPLLGPAVKAATPHGLKGTVQKALDRRGHTLPASPNSLDASDFIQRFFQAGPTNLFNILQTVDGLIGSVNQADTAACTAAAATPYTLATAGGNVQMFAQCYNQQSQHSSGDPGLFQWGVSDGNFYVYHAAGAAWVAAIASPLAGAADANLAMNANVASNANLSMDANAYLIQAWFGVGYTNDQLPAVPASGNVPNAWFNGSYATVALVANPQTKTFEMTAAGVGIGYCGAQFASDGNSIFGIGSTDMGSTCNSAKTVCLEAATAVPRSTACSVQQTNFALTPVGRRSSVSLGTTFAASAYPGSSANQVVVDGTASDSVHFGPVEPPLGVTAFAGAFR
jgi:hypothetical protein